MAMAHLRISILVLSFVFLSFAFSEAKDVIVGGKYISWNVDSSKTLTEWVQNKRFRVDDQLKWKSDKDSDSVLQVRKEDYESCETSKPIKTDVTEITLDQAGPFYFISGVKEHCDKGLKLVVIAKPPKHVSPSPAPSTAAVPAAPPSTTGAAGPGFNLSNGLLGFAIVLVGMALI